MAVRTAQTVEIKPFPLQSCSKWIPSFTAKKSTIQKYRRKPNSQQAFQSGVIYSPKFVI